MAKLVYEEECYEIVGACFNVYNDKGCGFLEQVYQECLEIEFEHLGIPYVSQMDIDVSYRGRKLKQHYRADFVCCGKIMVELKAVSAIVDEHRAQLLNYLNASGLKLGLLVNFGHHPGLQHERMVL